MTIRQATEQDIPQMKEIFAHARACMDFALRHYATIRIDTHRDNQPMQNAIRKAGFTYCGIIYCWDGSERLAFQYN